MDIDRAAGVLVALRRGPLDEAFDEIVDAAQRHRVEPVRIARALVALAEGAGYDDDPATAAARYEWGTLLEPTAVAT
jgi:hypothetical protein